MISPAPRHSLLIIGKGPHLGILCPARLCCSLEVVLVPYCKGSVLSFLEPKVTAEERLRARETEENGGRDARLFSCF
jgi:hypothetical protein